MGIMRRGASELTIDKFEFENPDRKKGQEGKGPARYKQAPCMRSIGLAFRTDR